MSACDWTVRDCSASVCLRYVCMLAGCVRLCSLRSVFHYFLGREVCSELLSSFGFIEALVFALRWGNLALTMPLGILTPSVFLFTLHFVFHFPRAIPSELPMARLIAKGFLEGGIVIYILFKCREKAKLVFWHTLHLAWICAFATSGL